MYTHYFTWFPNFQKRSNDFSNFLSELCCSNHIKNLHFPNKNDVFTMKIIWFVQIFKKHKMYANLLLEKFHNPNNFVDTFCKAELSSKWAQTQFWCWILILRVWKWIDNVNRKDCHIENDATILINVLVLNKYWMCKVW